MDRSGVVYGILVICFAFSVAHAQHVSGNLEGRIVDISGNSLPDVNITVSGDDVLGTRGTSTNKRGRFRVLALPVGSVTVTISHIGYQPVKYENVPVSLGKTTTLGEVGLTLKTIELSTVVVTSTRPVIDPNSSAISANIAAAEFEALPIDRDYQSIIALLPQANISFIGDDVNIGGATGMENAYFIDGMNTTDPFQAIGGTQLPYNFVKEIEVKSGGYEAEFGRATGGIINVITYSGGNEFKAKTFGFFSNNAFGNDGRRGFLDLRAQDFIRYDAGFSLGGPIMRDRLWFFLAYDNKIEKEDIQLPGLGITSDKKVTNSFAGKLTWRPSATTNFVLSVFGDPLDWDRIGHNFVISSNPAAISNADPFLGKWQKGGINVSMKANHFVGESLQLEASLARYSADFVAEAATERGRNEPLFRDNTTGTWSGGYGAEFDRQSSRCVFR